jgi:hypothetical protein
VVSIKCEVLMSFTSWGLCGEASFSSGKSVKFIEQSNLL